MSFLSSIFCCKPCRQTEEPNNRDDVTAVRLTQSVETIQTNQADNTPKSSASNVTPLLTTPSIELPSFLTEEAIALGLKLNQHIKDKNLNPTVFFHDEMLRQKNTSEGGLNLTAMSFIAFQSYCTPRKIFLKYDELQAIFFSESSFSEYFPDGIMNRELIKYLLENNQTGIFIYEFLTEDKYKDIRRRDLSASELLFIHSILQKTWRSLIIKYNKNTFIDMRNTKEDFINLVLKLKEFGTYHGSYDQFINDLPSIKSEINFNISDDELDMVMSQ